MTFGLHVSVKGEKEGVGFKVGMEEASVLVWGIDDTKVGKTCEESLDKLEIKGTCKTFNGKVEGILEVGLKEELPLW